MKEGGMDTNRRKTRGWLACTLAVGLLITLGLVLWTADRHLLRHAKPITPVSALAGDPYGNSILWLNDREFLYVGQEHEQRSILYHFDTHTKQSTRLADLTHLLEGGSLEDISPDGKRILGRQVRKDKQYWITVGVDGSHRLSWPSERVEMTDHVMVTAYSYVRWMGDSRHVAEFLTNEGSIEVSIHDVITGAVTKHSLRGFSGNIGEAELSNNGLVLATDWNAYSHTDLGIIYAPGSDPGSTFYSWALTAPTVSPHHWNMHSKAPAEVTNLQVSPDGKHIAWTLMRKQEVAWQAYLHRILPRIAVESQPRWEIWLSDTESEKMRRIGYEEISKSKEDDYFYPPKLQWLPDGKRLGFVYNAILYTLAVEE
jgi:hypothetical protein